MNRVEQRLLDTACRLFYQDGIGHVGVDRIVHEAKVAKMSLYKAYGSKDGLVVAFLEESHRRWRDWFLERLGDRHGDSAVIHFFAVLDEWLRVNAYRGCPLINAAAELADADHPGMVVVEKHRRYLRTMLAEVIQADGVKPDALRIDELLILMDGAIVGAAMGQVEAAITAGQAAAMLMQSYVAKEEAAQ